MATVGVFVGLVVAEGSVSDGVTESVKVVLIDVGVNLTIFKLSFAASGRVIIGAKSNSPAPFPDKSTVAVMSLGPNCWRASAGPVSTTCTLFKSNPGVKPEFRLVNSTAIM